jgi:rhamnogalacturonan hydrolase
MIVATAVRINKAAGLAIQMDGLITLVPDGAFSGNAVLIENSNDVELFSSNGLGAISGQGYITIKGKARQNAWLIRFTTCSHVTVHDLLLVDSPTFHLVFNGVSNLHVYQMTIRGADVGGTDGIDLQCADNCYLHHIQVTNKDGCISVKSPSQNTLIEDIYCNQSGGMSIGSVTADGRKIFYGGGYLTDNVTVVPAGMECAVSNITMRNIYAYQCTQMLMIKSFPGGKGAAGYVNDSLFENFTSYDSTYGLDIDQFWNNIPRQTLGLLQSAA